MTEARLEAWVRGELSTTQRREVSRWLVRCTDPDLPKLLRGITRADAEQSADAQLLRLGPAWRVLVEGWAGWLDRGLAKLTSPGAGAFALAGLGPEGAPACLTHLQGAEGDLVQLQPQGELEHALYLSSDAGQVLVLLAPTLLSGPVRVQLPTGLGRRVTLWAFWADALPRSSDPLGELASCVEFADGEALRLDPEEQ